MNGKTIDGHYFLSNHGHLTEVSNRVFVYSEVHTVIFMVLGILAIPLAVIANRQKKNKG
jgi:hypothetical protein